MEDEDSSFDSKILDELFEEVKNDNALLLEDFPFPSQVGDDLISDFVSKKVDSEHEITNASMESLEQKEQPSEQLWNGGAKGTYDDMDTNRILSTSDKIDDLLNDILQNLTDDTDDDNGLSSFCLDDDDDEEDGMISEWKRLKEAEDDLRDELERIVNDHCLSSPNDDEDEKMSLLIQYILTDIIPKCFLTTPENHASMKEVVRASVIILRILSGGIRQIWFSLPPQNSKRPHDKTSSPGLFHYICSTIWQLLRFQYWMTKYIIDNSNNNKKKNKKKKDKKVMFQHIIGWSWERTLHPIQTIGMAWNGIGWSLDVFHKHRNNIMTILHPNENPSR